MLQNKEQWLEDWEEMAVPMEFFPTSYRVSRNGNIYRWEKMYLKWVKCETFRFQGGVSVKVDRNWWSLAEKIANHFVPNPLNFGTVAFKDGDYYNCKADNLFWCDNSTSGTFREGACDGFMCFDVKQNHLGMIRSGKKTLFLYPLDYEFLPELGKEYPICYSTRCLKQGIDKNALKYNRDKGTIKITKIRGISNYDSLDLDDFIDNGIIDAIHPNGNSYTTVHNGRVFYGDDSISNASNNLMMSMFGRIPEQVIILEFEYKENKQDEI